MSFSDSSIYRNKKTASAYVLAKARSLSIIKEAEFPLRLLQSCQVSIPVRFYRQPA